MGPGPLEVLGLRRSGNVSLGKFGTQLCSLSHLRYTVPLRDGVAAMKDMQAQLEKLRTDAAECALIRDLATARRNESCSQGWPIT